MGSHNGCEATAWLSIAPTSALTLVERTTALAIMAAMCFRISSGCRAGASPASEEMATGAVALQTVRDCDCSTRRKAERERIGSAAKLIQRAKTRVKGGQYRVATARQVATNTRGVRPPERENSRRKISHRHVPNLLFSQKRQRAGFCSTAPVRIVPFVSQAWNGMGTRFAPCRFPLRPPRTRNDSRPRSTSRSQSRQQHCVWSRSHAPNSFCGVSTQMFSCDGLATGAISPGAIPPGGTTSLGLISLPLGWSNWGCCTRSASNIAVNSSAAAK